LHVGSRFGSGSISSPKSVQIFYGIYNDSPRGLSHPNAIKLSRCLLVSIQREQVLPISSFSSCFFLQKLKHVRLVFITSRRRSNGRYIGLVAALCVLTCIFLVQIGNRTMKAPDGGDDPKKSGSEVRRVFHRPSQSLTCHQAIGVSDAMIATAGMTTGPLGSHHLSHGGGRNPGRQLIFHHVPTSSPSSPSSRARQFERHRTPTAAVAPAKAV
jgi:hypothetical protein